MSVYVCIHLLSIELSRFRGTVCQEQSYTYKNKEPPIWASFPKTFLKRNYVRGIQSKTVFNSAKKMNLVNPAKG